MGRWRPVRVAASILFLLFLMQVQSAQIYVRDGASGSGISWADAYDSISSAYTAASRGDTIWVADGTYGTLAASKAVSGTSAVTIKKATAAAHGTDTGWLDSYGDGEALFTGSSPVINFSTGYQVLDGVIGGGAKSAGGYGFRIASSNSRSTSGTAIDIQRNVDSITIQNCEIDWNNGSGTTTTAVTRGIQMNNWNAGGGSNNDITIRSNYIHHSSGFALYLGAIESGGVRIYPRRVYVEHNYFHDNGGGGGVSSHWELSWVTYGEDIYFRYNTTENVFGPSNGQTGWFMFGGCSNVVFSGNLLFSSSGSTVVGGNGLVSTWSNDTYNNTNVSVINNTFVDINDDDFVWFHNSANDVNVVFKNNIHYSTAGSFTGVDTHSHSAFGGGITAAGSNQQTGLTTAIFTDYANDDFTLASATTAGDSTVGSAFATDPDGLTRGDDGTWDRGAFEYDPSQSGGGETGGGGAAVSSTITGTFSISGATIISGQ